MENIVVKNNKNNNNTKVSIYEQIITQTPTNWSRLLVAKGKKKRKKKLKKKE